MDWVLALQFDLYLPIRAALAVVEVFHGIQTDLALKLTVPTRRKIADSVILHRNFGLKGLGAQVVPPLAEQLPQMLVRERHNLLVQVWTLCFQLELGADELPAVSAIVWIDGLLYRKDILSIKHPPTEGTFTLGKEIVVCVKIAILLLLCLLFSDLIGSHGSRCEQLLRVASALDSLRGAGVFFFDFRMLAQRIGVYQFSHLLHIYGLAVLSGLLL